MPPGRLRAAAPFLDLACLALFVLIGRGRHDIHSGVGWFLTVLWPLVVGWFAVAFATRLYSAPTRPWLRLVATWGLGLAFALALRAIVLERQPISTFTVVLYGFVALETFGWRAVALGIRRLTPAARSRAGAASSEV